MDEEARIERSLPPGYEVCMPSRRLLSIVARFIRDTTRPFDYRPLDSLSLSVVFLSLLPFDAPVFIGR